MKIIRYASIAAVGLIWLASLQAATVQVTPGPDGKDRVVLDNGVLQLQIDPNRGARVDSFQCGPWGAVDIIADKRGQGLLVDHFWQEYWPGQFWEAKYEYQVVSPGPQEVAVKFTCLSVDKGVPQVAGIRLEKTVTLRENERTAQVAIRLTNTGTEGKYLGYWMQNIAWMGGDKAGDLYFRPGKRGVSQVSSDDTSPPDGGFVREPQAGWTAALDTKTQTGMVWQMDYNSLWFLYNCTPASTIEWQDDAVAIPGGKSWETRVTMTPFAGLSAVSYASPRLLLGVEVKENKEAGRLEVTENLLATSHPVKALEVQTSLETLINHLKAEGGAAQTLPEVGFSPQTVQVSLPWDTTKREPTVLRLSLKGQTGDGQAFTEKVELFYKGVWLADTVPMDGSILYPIPSPPKVKALVKPDKIERIVKDRPQVLFLKGLLAPHYRLGPALRRVSPEAVTKEGFLYNSGVFGWGLDYFPYDYDTLMSYDLVILGGLNASGLNDTGMEMLKDYCEHGGNLLVLGGPYAYGNGGYQGTVLAKLLPVTVQGAFDLRPAGSGTVRSALPAAALSPDALPALRPQYLHRVKALPDTQVLLSYGEWPLLVRGQYGQGQVYCVTAPPLGDPCYCDTPQWQQVLRYLFTEMGMNR